MGRKKSFWDTESTTQWGTLAPPWQQQPPPEPAPRKVSDKNVGTIEGDVGVPTLQAFIVALPVSIFGTMIAIGVIVWQRLEWWIAPLVLVAAWSGTAGCLAWSNVGKRQRLWQQEIILQRDLDGDGVIGPPEEETLNVLITEKNGPGSKSKLFEFGLGPDIAALFCETVLRDGDLTEGTWKRTWLDGQRVFSGVDDYRQLRNRMEQAGLVAPKNPHAKSQGFELTRTGKVVFKRTAKEYSPNGRG